MPVVFYILGAIFALASAYFAAAVFSDAVLFVVTNTAAALGAGIIAAIFISTAAIAEAILTRRNEE